jgi:imidazolonepropionase-like amidohydrolase
MWRLGTRAGLAVLLAAIVCSAPPALAQQDSAVLFRNVKIFDGKNGTLSAASNVLIRDGKIEKVSIADVAAAGEVIEGGGRVLMPGLIDAHWHAMLVRPTPMAAIAGDIGYNNLLAASEATATLMRGFTTVRDMGGPSFGLKQAIDEDLVAGPRIYPSGAMITITGGHGDFRQLSDLPRTIGGMLSRMERIGGSMVADSPDEVRVRAREQLMQGASQVKLTAGGGVASPSSPLDVATFTEPELRAAVEAADSWGTYVATHAYTPVAIQRSIAAGVRCIEHGHLMDGASAKLIAEKGIWLSTRCRAGTRRAGQDAAGRCRHRPGLCACKEIPHQDRVRHRHPVLEGVGGQAGLDAGRAGALVHASRGAGHGDVDQCGVAEPVRSAQSLSRQARRGGGRRAG